MAKLSLQPNPTFKAKVGIPVPGADPAEVEFTFKHRSRTEITAWVDVVADKSDAEAVLDMATAWDLDDAFTSENLARLCDQYAGAGAAIFAGYLRELRGVRAKN